MVLLVLRSSSSRLKVLSHNICVKLLSSSCTHKNSKSLVNTLSNPQFRLVFLGNDHFSLESLKVITHIVDAKTCVKVVVSNPKNIIGKYALANSLDCILWDEFKNQENKETFDVGVVASFGHLIPKRIIEKCQLGILNVHGSLLPKYRGAAPIARSIINGDSETGISIMKIAPHKFDIGPILYQKKCPIHPHIRTPELTQLLAVIGSLALKEVLLNLDNFINNVGYQSETEATFASKLTPDMAQVDWENLSALQVYNLFRGLNGFFKLTTFYNDKKVDIDQLGLVRKVSQNENDNIHTNYTGKLAIGINTNFSIYYPEPVSISMTSDNLMWDESKFIPGQIFVKNDVLFIKCKDRDGWVFCKKIKMGTKWMSPKDFQNGFISKSKSLHLFQFKPQNTEDLKNVKQLKNS